MTRGGKRDQRGSATPPAASTPATMTTENDAMPISGLGNPNNDPCQDCITEPHEIVGSRLQPGT